VDLLERLSTHLSHGNSARGFLFNDDETALLQDLPLLSSKPVIYLANIAEEDLERKHRRCRW
jgi:ribosome-binding ATPase YchF (GTP1/OBG family)